MSRGTGIDCTQLTHQALAGDRQAEDELWKSLRPMVRGFFGSRVRHADHADDLTQTTLMRSSSGLTRFRNDCPISQWVLRIALNELRRYYERGLGPETIADDDPALEAGLQRMAAEGGPIEQIESVQYAERLLEAARRVCSPLEFTVLMMVYRGESLTEIAELLAMDGATVRSHQRRGRAKLLVELLTRDVELLGGDAAVESARLQAEVSEGLSREEAEALTQRSGKQDVLRSACMKMAKHLAVPVAAVLLFGLAWMEGITHG